MNSPSRATRIAIDIGGTFTDVVATTADGRIAVHKLLSTPSDYADAVLEGIGKTLDHLGHGSDDLAEIIHATTVATNAILERKGASCALVTTQGFRDVLEIGRLRVPELYNIFYDKRPILVPRHRVFEVVERIDRHGTVLIEIDRASVERAIEGLRGSGVEAVAVCLFNAYASSRHERTVAEAIRAALPGLDVSVSSDILPQIGEFERTSTTVIDAYVKPKVRSYLSSLRRRMSERAIGAPLLIMQCGGGLTSAERAAAEPVNLIESGPAAGVLAAREYLSRLGTEDAISFDMGGTTAKASIIEKGAILRTREYEVGGSISATARLTGGGGYPIVIPVIDVAEVGAGGGSIARAGDGRPLRVGPDSAGAAPGPVCYARGGTQPTVTDANLVLGYLNPDGLAGGKLPIDRAAAEAAIDAAIARPLGLSVADAAYGIHLIANSEMSGAIRAVSTQRGRDVRRFALIAFGGSGPLHAVELARGLGMPQVIVPPSPGLFSAFGLLATDLEASRGRTLYRETGEVDPAELGRIAQALRDEVAAMFGRRDGVDAPLSFRLEADLRYWGQSYELPIAMEWGRFDAQTVPDLVERFGAEHERTYGQRAKNERVIVVSLRVVGSLPAGRQGGGGALGARLAPAQAARRAYFGRERGWHTARVLRREELSERFEAGPLLIEEYDSVTVVPPGSAARRGAADSIIVAVNFDEERRP